MELNGSASTYVVKEGDTLAEISRKAYGTDGPAALPHIYNNNRGRIDMSGTMIPGTVLNLPTFER